MSTPRTVTSPSVDGEAGVVERLLVVHAPHASDVGRILLLGREAQRIGRASTNDTWPLQDPEVSRVHLELVPEAEGYLVRDLASRNGVFVNGARIRETRLQQAGVLRLGSTLLLHQRVSDLDSQLLLDAAPTLGGFVGGGPAHARLQRALRLALPGKLAVLITGATGVGKELVARALHDASERQGEFVAVNCGALPEALMESELFGHVAGAFTGAQAREGLFARAHEGTLFLDEVGELKLATQASLLRALATGEVRRLGSDQTRHTDVRVVAATNVDLQAAIARGQFRPDLYARLAGHVIHVPPLAERREDVLPLLSHFLRQRKLHAVVGADVAEALLLYHWPFNVRELEQLVGRLEPSIRAARRLQLSDLPASLALELRGRERGRSERPANPASLRLLGVRRDVAPSREELLSVLAYTGNNVSAVAAFFSKGRRQIYRWIEQHEIDLKHARAGAAPPAFETAAEGGSDR